MPPTCADKEREEGILLAFPGKTAKLFLPPREAAVKFGKFAALGPIDLLPAEWINGRGQLQSGVWSWSEVLFRREGDSTWLLWRRDFWH
jgi:hypothetical protein